MRFNWCWCTSKRFPTGTPTFKHHWFLEEQNSPFLILFLLRLSLSVILKGIQWSRGMSGESGSGVPRHQSVASEGCSGKGKLLKEILLLIKSHVGRAVSPEQRAIKACFIECFCNGVFRPTVMCVYDHLMNPLLLNNQCGVDWKWSIEANKGGAERKNNYYAGNQGQLT